MEFIAVTDAESWTRSGTAALCDYNAPARSLCLAIYKSPTTVPVNTLVQDCSAAMENILIAAAEWIWAVWIGVYPPCHDKACQEIFNIPEAVTPWELPCSVILLRALFPAAHEVFWNTALQSRASQAKAKSRTQNIVIDVQPGWKDDYRYLSQKSAKR